MAEQPAGPHYDITPLLTHIERGCHILTPNLRLSRLIRAQWDARQAAAGLRVWRPLAVQPLEGWLQQQWRQRCLRHAGLRRTPLGSGETLALWRQVIAEDQERQGYSLLQLDAAASLAQQARSNLLRWRCRPDDEQVAAEFSFDPDCQAFLRWCRDFEARLATGGLATALDIVVLLDNTPGEATDSVVLLEFDDVPPLYRSALSKLCVEVIEQASAATPAPAEVYAYPEPAAELRAVARWARQCYEAQPDASIGIVLGDMRDDRAHLEYLLRSEFGCLEGDYGSLPVNFSTGWPLADVPVVRDALLALSCCGEQIALGDVLALARSRFLALPDRHSPGMLLLLRRLFEDGRERLSVATLRNRAGVRQDGDEGGLVLGDILRDIAQRRELRQRRQPSGWGGLFRRLLETWGWPGTAVLDSLEYQQVEAWHEALEALASYDVVCSQLDLPEALALLRNHCRDTMFQPRTPASRLQVLGPLEAAGMRFDHLWLVGMQAGQWPAPARPSPLLPVALQRRLGMPHASAEREWLFASGLVDQYRRSAGRLYASYSHEVDGVPELPSALLSSFEVVATEAVPQVHERWLAMARDASLEQIDDERAPPVTAMEGEKIRGGSGLVEDQSQCPFRAFARRRLGVQALAETSLALDAAERGALLHAALYALWGDIGDAEGLAGRDQPALQDSLRRALDAAWSSIPERRRLAVGQAWFDQERIHLQRLLGQWLDCERQRPPFNVLAREAATTLEIGPLTLQLRVDRIDQLEDGSLLVIDYKSGKSRVSDWLGERPARPQLPLYSLTTDGRVAALAFAQVRPRDCHWVGLGETSPASGILDDVPRAVRDRAPVESWDALCHFWRDSLTRLVEDFTAGEAAVDPLGPSSCTWCGLQALCRVDVQRGPITDGAEEGE